MWTDVGWGFPFSCSCLSQCINRGLNCVWSNLIGWKNTTFVKCGVKVMLFYYQLLFRLPNSIISRECGLHIFYLLSINLKALSALWPDKRCCIVLIINKTIWNSSVICFNIRVHTCVCVCMCACVCVCVVCLLVPEHYSITLGYILTKCPAANALENRLGSVWAQRKCVHVCDLERGNHTESLHRCVRSVCLAAKVALWNL